MAKFYYCFRCKSFNQTDPEAKSCARCQSEVSRQFVLQRIAIKEQEIQWRIDSREGTQ